MTITNTSAGPKSMLVHPTRAGTSYTFQPRGTVSPSATTATRRSAIADDYPAEAYGFCSTCGSDRCPSLVGADCPVIESLCCECGGVAEECGGDAPGKCRNCTVLVVHTDGKSRAAYILPTEEARALWRRLLKQGFERF